MKLNWPCICLIALSIAATPALAKKDPHQLPPGLQKKVAQGKSLPPGWQKKLAAGDVLQSNVYRYGVIIAPVNSNGVEVIRVEGKIIRLLAATREIVEILK